MALSAEPAAPSSEGAALASGTGVSAERRLTPMLRQYLEAKAACPEALLMFRMGDFFELFFEDAKVAARELELTLTARDKGADPIPMAGVPHQAAPGYIARLVDRGYSVALCDQVEDPKLARGLVKREITRIITPGTVCDLEALRPGVANYLGCLWPTGDGPHVLGLLDVLAGDLMVTRVALAEVADEVGRLGVRELLVPPAEEAAVRLALGDCRVAVRVMPAADVAARAAAGDAAATAGAADAAVRAGAGNVAASAADAVTTAGAGDAAAGAGAARVPLARTAAEAAQALLERRFGTAAIAGLDDGGGAAERQAVARLIAFAEGTQRRALPHLQRPRAYRIADFLVLDACTRAALELTHSQMDGGTEGSLLWHLDRCRTAMGSRTLGRWLAFPERRHEVIDARQQVVGHFRRERAARGRLRDVLAGVRDVERLMGRVAIGRAGPRDLAALRQSLAALPALAADLADCPGPLGARWRGADLATALHAELAAALVDQPPPQLGDGSTIRAGYCRELDALMAVADEGHGFLAALEARERARTGIGSLKVRYNRVFGYYLEVTRANLAQVPDDYIRKQTLVGAERYITPELKDYEERVLHADERRQARETVLFTALTATVSEGLGTLRALAQLLAATDALLALAEVADVCRYVQPELVDAPVLTLAAGRHPVLERLLPGGERFVPNDLALDAASRQLLLVTGPNMAGKSTVMRQAALITIMAHMGSFVPAERAVVGLCDRIFTRVGAADNLGRGHSTFMVEMLETARILRHATPQSLVLLDEVGRGTSTYDGVSLAWAIAEHLHDALRCRAMFATHYHELAELSRPRIVPVAVQVAEERGRVVFLRRLADGAASRSYGIQVARLAGVPEAVLARAREVLAGLEGHSACACAGAGASPGPSLRASEGAAAGGQLGLFAAAPAVPRRSGARGPRGGRRAAAGVGAAAPAGPGPEAAAVLARLQACQPDAMTPLQALVFLEELRQLVPVAR